MDDSFHYLSMINHMTVQKKLMEQLKDTGLTLGHGRKRPDRKKNAQWKPSYFSYFYDRIRKEKSEACGGGF